jgi:glutamine synthetase
MSDKLAVPSESLPGGGLTPASTPKSGAEALEFAKARKVAQVDLKFVDLPGQWQHFTIPINQFGEDAFAEGVGFDGSSIRGFQAIQESDMLLFPDPSTAVIDPFSTGVPTLSMICNVKDPISGASYTRDPRYVAQKAEAYVKSTGLADSAYFGPEAEFFVFDSVRFDQNQYSGYYFIDSDEGAWNSGRQNDGKPNLGHRPRYKEGYFPVAPLDTLQDIRTQMTMTLIALGIDVETHHHEVATAGQCEIDMHFGTLTKMADQMLMYKYVIHNVASRNGKTATFMPKPLFADNGSGMHVHQSLWTDGKPLFADPTGYAGLSQMAKWYIGGLLKHAPALLALTSPTTNSYRRLVPGYEAPVNLVFSQRNRSAACRIPMYSQNPKAKRVEFRCPDPLANPYLAFSAMLMAGLDGILNKIDPGEPLDVDIFELSAEEKANVKTVPGSLQEALDALEKDHAFLLEGGVFTKDLLEVYIAYKRSREVDPVRLRPHPYEFYLYYEL